MGLREDTCRILANSPFSMNSYQPAVSVCGTACCIAGKILLAAGIDPDSVLYQQVPKQAKSLWAAHYGQEEADRLEFTECGWGDNLEAVTAEEAIAHLNGAAPVVHNGFNEED